MMGYKKRNMSARRQFRRLFRMVFLMLGILNILLVMAVTTLTQQHTPCDHVSCTCDVKRRLNQTEPTVAQVTCNPGIPCVYPEEVDFRVIVITFNRANSLYTLLKSLDLLELDGASASMEIWIDRSRHNNSVHRETLDIARSFNWTRGVKRVHVQRRHVGIYGQWIDTWRPMPRGNELGVILEDDMSVSPYIYHWIKAAHQKYGPRKDVAGYTLQSEGVGNFVNLDPIRGPKSHTAYMFRMIGTWGYAPRPDTWITFQNWYHRTSVNPDYHPYIEKATILTKWCKAFEQSKQQDTFWEIWFGHYCEIHDLFSVYNNLRVCSGKYNVFLSANRKEKGLHFAKKRPDNADKLLTAADWSENYFKLPDKPERYDWNGSMI